MDHRDEQSPAAASGPGETQGPQVPSDAASDATQPPLPPAFAQPGEAAGGEPTEQWHEPSPFPGDVVTTKRGGSRLVAVLAALVLLIGAGAAVVLTRSSSQESAVAEKVPGEAIAFAQVWLEPSTGQQQALRRLLDRLPESSRDGIGDGIDSLLQTMFSESGIDYAKDVKPWVGGELAFAALPGEGAPSAVGLLSVIDEGAARATLQRIAAEEEDFVFEVADGIAYVSDSRAPIDAALATRPESSLTKNAEFRAAVDPLGDALAIGWLSSDGARLLSSGLVAGIGSSMPPGAPTEGGAIALRAEDTALAVVGRGPAPQADTRSGRPQLLESGPASILGALTLFDVGGIFEAAAASMGEGGAYPLELLAMPLAPLGLNLQRDIIPWLHGELSVVVGGVTGQIPEVGLVVESTDDEALGRTMAALRERLPALGREAGFAVERTEDGFLLELPIGASIDVRHLEGRFIAASTTAFADALAGASSPALADDAVYRRSLGSTDGTAFQMYVRLDKIRGLLDGLLPTDARGTYDEQVAPFLQLFDSFVVQARIEGSSSVFRMALVTAE